MTREKPAVLSAGEITKALLGLPDWRERLGALHTAFVAPTAADALSFIAAVGRVSEALDHHPDLDWRYDHVFVRTTTHEAGLQLTARDVQLAGEISALAADAGARAQPALSRTIELGIDTADPHRLEETWLAALGYRRGRPGDFVDPWGRGPTIWFQQTPLPAASRLHLDVHVVPEIAAEVLTTVESTGGSLRESRFAPSWWVVADADGNRLCVCTPDGRAAADAPEST
jgi:4a-hydroxytetrahydrobiopterin dehydratase